MRTFSGAAKPGVQSRISFKVSGTIEELPLNVGDLVRKGDLIARLDPRDYELRVEQGAASLAQTEAQTTEFRAQLEELTRRATTLQADNETLAASDGEQRARIDTLTHENLELRAGARWPEWITGGGIVLVGMVLGAFLKGASGRSRPRIRL